MPAPDDMGWLPPLADLAGVADDLILKAVGSLGAVGALIWLAREAARAFGAHLDKERLARERERADDRAAQAEERKLFAATLEKVGSDMRVGLAEVKGGMETLRNTMVEMDKGHTVQNRETFLQVFQVFNKHADALTLTGQKVDLLDERVGRIQGEVSEIKHAQDSQGDKLDELVRSIPARLGPPSRPPPPAKLPPP